MAEKVPVNPGGGAVLPAIGAPDSANPRARSSDPRGGLLLIFLDSRCAAGTMIPLPYARPSSAAFCDPIQD